MKVSIDQLEKKLNINFKDKNKLIKSLTHKSFNSKENNEKYEFLGDRVLGLVISKKLLEIYPDEREGSLDKKFASLVNKKTCLKIAKKINLEKFILTLDKNKNKFPPQDKVISDSCEALLGAVYLDKGFSTVEKIIMERENSISFRLATVFGTSERMRVDLLVNNFTYIAVFEKYLKLYEPHFRRNYIHILDVVKGLIFGITNFEKLKNNIYNLGLSEANLTKEQLCKTIQDIIPDFKYEISLDGKDEDKRDYFVSNAKIEKMGFKAAHSLEAGILELKKYYNSNKSITKNY